MEAKAFLRHARISPRKVCIVLDLIRNKPVEEASAILKYTPKAASPLCLKLLNSAVANAENNNGMDRGKLIVSQCFVAPGPALKRMRPQSKGRGVRIIKRTSHITIAVAEKE
jgi:large subunit ribosomal protein L22